jgi:hypothetical protein
MIKINLFAEQERKTKLKRIADAPSKRKAKIYPRTP